MKIKTFLLLSLFLFSRSSHLSADFPVNNHIQIGGAVWPWVAYSGESLWIQLPEKKQPVAGSILQVQFRTTGLPVINQAPIALPQTSSFVTTPLTAPTVCGLYWIDFTWTKDNQVLSQSEHPFAVISNQEKGDSAYGSCVISSFKFDRRGTDRPDLALLVGTTWNRPIIEWNVCHQRKPRPHQTCRHNMKRIYKKIRQFVRAYKIALLAILLVVVIVGLWVVTASAAPSQFPRNAIIRIEKDMTVSEAATLFKEKGLIKSSFVYKTYVTLLNDGKGIQAGSYLFDEHLSAYPTICASRCKIRFLACFHPTSHICITVSFCGLLIALLTNVFS
jgi:predicted nucleic acid-binding Zn ribbon protein